MKIGVTGGAGYIGSHVVADLLEKGHKIIVLDNLSTGNPKNIPQHPDYTFAKGDIRNESDLDSFFREKPEIIFRFAALKAAGDSMVSPDTYSSVNIRGSFLLMEKMKEHNCRYMVFSSSAAVYGDPEYVPMDESHPLRPANYYGFTKKAIEENLVWYSKIYAIRFAALRYFNAAGMDIRGRIKGLETNPNNLLPILMEVAVGQRKELQIYGTDYDTPDGTCIRDYIHVNDLSRAHLLAMDYIIEKNEDLIVNLGVGNGISVKEIRDTAEKSIGVPIPYKETERRPGDPPVVIASSSLAKEKIGWEAEYSDGETLLKSMWEVYKQK